MNRFLAALAAAALAACAAIPEAPAPAPPPIAEQLAELKTRMFVHVVEERQRLNAAAKPLRLDPELADAAQAHSEAMARDRAFGEEGAQNNVAIQQLAASPTFQGFVGGVAAMQYFTPELGFDPDAYARAFIAQWVRSPDHRENIENAVFDRTGIGVAANGNAIYASEIFAADLGLAPPQ